MLQTLDSFIDRLSGLEPEEKDRLFEEAKQIIGSDIWIANPGPQTAAYYSEADLLFYGGQGGGDKTDLMAGLALAQHQRSLLLRPQYTDLGALIERVVAIAGTRKGLNSAPPAQFKIGNRVVDFGAAATMDRAETWQGNPHDLVAFDEACQFQESVVRFLMGWNRSADMQLGGESRQRVRTVMASNPPISAEGEWVVGMFRPWLDITYSDPAEHGELRWFIVDPDGRDLEVDGPDDVRTLDGTDYTPRSRTFIPAALSDNPFLADTGYQATLDAMPEPLRSAIRDGNFMASREDDEWQVIPTSWILEANNRWLEEGRHKQAMTTIGLDVARGGRDDTVFAPRHGLWSDRLTVVPGRRTPYGPSVAVLAAGMIRILSNEYTVFLGKWFENFSQLCETSSRIHIAFLGTALLAKAVSLEVDAFAVKAGSEHPGVYSARTLGHGVLVPNSPQLGIYLGVTGREPLNNQPCFRIDLVDHETPIHTNARHVLTLCWKYWNCCNR